MLGRIYHSRWLGIALLAFFALALGWYIHVKDDQAIHVANKANCERIQQVANTVNPTHHVLRGIAYAFVIDRRSALERQYVLLANAETPEQRSQAKATIANIQRSVTTFQALSDAANQIPPLEC